MSLVEIEVKKLDPYAVNTKGAVEFTGLSRTTLYRCEQDGLIKPRYVRHKKLWVVSELISMIESRRQE